MALTYSITFPFSVLIPEEIAEAMPTFDFDQFSNALPVMLESGKSILIDNDFELAIRNYCDDNEDKTIIFNTLENELEQHAIIYENNTIACLVTFDNETEVLGFIDFVTPFGITVTPVTA
jgi:hypothetical protein